MTIVSIHDFIVYKISSKFNLFPSQVFIGAIGYLIFNRLGISEEAQGTTLSPEDEVNEFLERAIDARSVEHLKKANVRPIFLKFYKKEFEDKVN